MASFWFLTLAPQYSISIEDQNRPKSQATSQSERGSNVTDEKIIQILNGLQGGEDQSTVLAVLGEPGSRQKHCSKDLPCKKYFFDWKYSLTETETKAELMFDEKGRLIQIASTDSRIHSRTFDPNRKQRGR